MCANGPSKHPGMSDDLLAQLMSPTPMIGAILPRSHSRTNEFFEEAIRLAEWEITFCKVVLQSFKDDVASFAAHFHHKGGDDGEDSIHSGFLGDSADEINQRISKKNGTLVEMYCDEDQGHILDKIAKAEAQIKSWQGLLR